MTLLEDESMTVEDCGIEENQSILIEGRVDLIHVCYLTKPYLVMGIIQTYIHVY